MLHGAAAVVSVDKEPRDRVVLLAWKFQAHPVRLVRLASRARKAGMGALRDQAFANRRFSANTQSWELDAPTWTAGIHSWVSNRMKPA